MKTLKNQNGIALVTVLLMITVFSILGMAVISLSISNTKQIAKTEGEMQAVDLAEMGVVYYKNVFNLKAESAINKAIKEIEEFNEGKDIDQQIPITKENILSNIKKDNFIPEIHDSTPKQIPNVTSPYSFKIENLEATYIDYIISVKFNSVGYVNHEQGMKVEESITGTINLNIDKLLGSGGIEEEPPYVFEDTKMHDLELHIDGDADFKRVNGQIMNSNLYISGNATFGTINGGIHDSMLFISKKANFETINGQDIKGNSKICVGGTITDLSVDNVKVFSMLTDPDAYRNAGCPPIEENSNEDNGIGFPPASLKEDIAKQAKNMDLKYH